MSDSHDIPIPTTKESSSAKRFRWRLIPTLFLVPFGGMLVLGWIFDWITGVANGIQLFRTIVPLLMILAGVLWVVSGLCFWKCRWRLAVICLLFGWGFGCLGMWVYEEHPLNRELERAAAVSDAGLQARLDSYFGALIAGQHRVTIDMMDMRFFPNGAAKQEAIALLEKSTTAFTFHTITNGQPFGHFKGSNSVHCFVPFVSDAEIRGQRATVKSYLLATRYDGNTNWFFVDIGTKERGFLARYYDHLPHKLPKASLEKKE